MIYDTGKKRAERDLALKREANKLIPNVIKMTRQQMRNMVRLAKKNREV